MTNILRIRRRPTGGASGAPTGLMDSELAYSFVDDVLYIGRGTGGPGGTASSILAIAGKGSYMDISTDQTIGGNKTFSNTITGNISGNAGTASKWLNPRTLSWTGDVTGSMSVDGSGNVSQELTIGNSKVLTAHLNDGNVTNVKLAPIANGRIKGRSSLGTGDVEDLTASQVRTILNVADGSQPGTVTSINFSMPSIFTVSGDPITTSGVITVTLGNQNPNVVWAGPGSGGAAAPTFRSLVAADIPSLTASKITDFDTQVRSNRLDQLGVPTTSVPMNGQRLTNLADPMGPQDAATKAYVDASLQGLSVKSAVRMATTTNIALSGLQTIDGVIGVADDRVLVKNQTTGANNGIYLMKSSAWVRAPDFDTDEEAKPGSFVFIEQGSLYGDTGWVMTNNGSVTLGSTSLTWVQFSGAGSVTAGTGMTQSGTTLNVIGTAGRIAVSADAVDIDSNYLGQTSITTLGTVGTGVWQGTAVGMAYGGTGVNLTGVSNNSMLKKTSGGVAAAIAGTDYLDPSSTIDGGSF